MGFAYRRGLGSLQAKSRVWREWIVVFLGSEAFRRRYQVSFRVDPNNLTKLVDSSRNLDTRVGYLVDILLRMSTNDLKGHSRKANTPLTIISSTRHFETSNVRGPNTTFINNAYP